MGRPRSRARPPLRVSRDLERSRLQEQLIAAAYELAVPVVRRPVAAQAPGGRRDPEDAGDTHQRPMAAGGLSA